MIYPIFTYGQTVLRKKAEDIEPNFPELKTLISDMFETMDKAGGIGLAAPQIGLPIRVVVVGLEGVAEDYPELATFRKAFVNPHILETDGAELSQEEGCLSLPGIHENVKRKEKILVEYVDENFAPQKEWVSGFLARVLQHEIDHLEGHVFTDRISPIRRQMIKTKLNSLQKGKVKCSYKVK